MVKRRASKSITAIKEDRGDWGQEAQNKTKGKKGIQESLWIREQNLPEKKKR